MEYNAHNYKTITNVCSVKPQMKIVKMHKKMYKILYKFVFFFYFLIFDVYDVFAYIEV